MARWCRNAFALRQALAVGLVAEHYKRGEAVKMVGVAASATEEADLFWHRAEFIIIVFAHAEDIRTWGCGCECHAADRLAGRRAQCCLADRRRELA